MLIRCVSILLIATSSVTVARQWTEEVIYFAMTDRFADGDAANNSPAGADPSLYDPEQKDINRYHGGDFRGIEQALADGYFYRLGVTALWLTPVVRNCWRSGFDLGGSKTGYHGYWTQDWLDIDPHLTSRSALDGKPYPDTPEGRMRHYRDVVKLAQAQGIRVIQDVVLNHAGPVFFYDADGNDRFDEERESEWVQPFKAAGFHGNAKWAEIPKWNLRRTQPDGPRELLGVAIPTNGVLSRLDSYSRKGFSRDSLGKTNGEEIECDFFSLRDLWTAPGGPGFDALVDEFVAIYHFYLTTVGVDGLRVDTVKHVHRAFWDAFTGRLRQKLGPAAAEKIVFGEVYDGNPAVLGRHTWRQDAAVNPAPCMDAVLDFTLCFAVRDYLRHANGAHGTAHAVERAMAARYGAADDGRPFYNPTPGPDGLDSRQKAISFVENHDGLNRFRVRGVSEVRHRLAQALLLTLPGIPCLYYGAEVALADSHGRLGADGETGRLTLFRNRDGLSRKAAMETAAFRDIAQLAALRKEMPALQTGRFVPLWADGSGSEDDGVFAFARVGDHGACLVVMNASDKPRGTASNEFAMQLPAGLAPDNGSLVPKLVIGTGGAAELAPVPAAGKLRLSAPPTTVTIYEISSAPPKAAVEPSVP